MSVELLVLQPCVRRGYHEVFLDVLVGVDLGDLFLELFFLLLDERAQAVEEAEDVVCSEHGLHSGD